MENLCSQAIMFDEAECTSFRIQVNQARITPCQLVHNLNFTKPTTTDNFLGNLGNITVINFVGQELQC